MRAAAVVIGKDEGARLVRCLASLKGLAAPLVYVDSGSADGSVAAARAAGADVVELDMSRPFTAARARNAGLARLGPDDPPYVQVVDGDCEMRPGWIDTGADFLDAHPGVAAVAGRLRERAPEASVWNRLADAEWATGEGEVDAIGGIAMLRRDAIDAVGGYRRDLAAGEEPEMCLRLRRAGWKIHRLPDEMALHDIAMTRASQWWRRMVRVGRSHAAARDLHGTESYYAGELRRSLLWGVALPVVTLLGALLTPWALLLLLLWPLQVLRLKSKGHPWEQAIALTLVKLPEAQGALGWWLGKGR